MWCGEICVRWVVVLEPMDRGDARMVQRRTQLGLALKAGQPVGVLGKLFRQGLNRHLTTKLRIPRTPDLSHAALTKGRNDFVVREF